MTKAKASHYTNHRDMVLMKLHFNNNKSRTCEIVHSKEPAVFFERKKADAKCKSKSKS